MAQLKTHKFVSALPPVLEADAIYFVRAGSGFDLYVTNHSGTIVAYPANSGVDLSAYAPLASPAFTGTPTAPTQAAGNNSTRLATTAFTAGEINSQRPKGLSMFCSGKPVANEIVGSGIAPYAMTLSAANSKAQAVVAAAASTVFIIKKNNTNIGTVTFSAAGTIGVISISTTAVATNDLITIHAPATADGTLADITIQLRGT